MNTTGIKLGVVGKFIKKPKFPIKITLPLTCVIGHIIGDGSIHGDYYQVDYTNQSLELIEEFENNIQKIFGPIKPYKYYSTRDKTTIIRFPGIIGLILTKMIGPQTGDSRHIPKQLKNISKPFKAVFLRALYDDEGCVSITGHKIQLIMANESIIENVKEMLKEFNIKPTKTCKMVRSGRKDQFGFCVCSYNDIKTFLTEIGFTHPEKRRKLRTLIKGYKLIRRRNFGFQNDVLEFLKTNGEMSALKIADALNINSINGLRKELWRLEQKSIIKGKIQDNRKIYFVEAQLKIHPNQIPTT